jgi:hypothetical protein
LRAKAGDQAAPVRAALGLQPIEEAGVEALDEGAERGGKSGNRSGLVVDEREGGAPDLTAAIAVEIVEELGKAGDQIGFGKNHVDRQPDLEPVADFLDPLPDGAGMRPPFPAGTAEGGDRDRDQDAVQRLARPCALQEVEKGLPAGMVDRGVGILRRVAPGGVDQHRILGEPPVAEPRAADPGDRSLPHFRGQRKAQPGIQERRRLAGAGRADDRIPGLFVEIVAGAARLAQQVERGAELLLQRRRLLGRGGDRRIGGGRDDASGQGRVAAAPAEVEQQVDAGPQGQHRKDDREAHAPAFEEGEERAEEPDETGEECGADKAQQPARDEKSEHAAHPSSRLRECRTVAHSGARAPGPGPRPARRQAPPARPEPMNTGL